jgi:hypothetical protein
VCDVLVQQGAARHVLLHQLRHLWGGGAKRVGCKNTYGDIHRVKATRRAAHTASHDTTTKHNHYYRSSGCKSVFV